jgi:hypothetical protein
MIPCLITYIVRLYVAVAILYLFREGKKGAWHVAKIVIYQDLLALLAVIPSDLNFPIFSRLIEYLPDFRILHYQAYQQVCFPSALLCHLTEILHG